jgi:FK506-binding nuclear protein
MADGSEKLSKAEKKKKRKAENGAAVAVETPKEEAKKDGKKDSEAKKGKKEEAKDKKTETKQLPGGLQYSDSKVGAGPAAKKGQTVEMRYIGKLTNGTVFDKNVKGKPVGANMYFARNILRLSTVQVPSRCWRGYQGYARF